MSESKHRIFIALTVGLAVSAAAVTATDVIQERKKEMEGVRDGILALAAIAKKEQPFDADVVKSNAEKIATHLERSTSLFPEGSAEGETESFAKPEIWTDRQRFDELFASTIQAAIDLQSVTEETAFPPALGTLGNGCKSCHDLYRIPEQ